MAVTGSGWILIQILICLVVRWGDIPTIGKRLDPNRDSSIEYQNVFGHENNTVFGLGYCKVNRLENKTVLGLEYNTKEYTTAFTFIAKTAENDTDVRLEHKKAYTLDQRTDYWKKVFHREYQTIQARTQNKSQNRIKNKAQNGQKDNAQTEQ